MKREKLFSIPALMKRTEMEAGQAEQALIVTRNDAARLKAVDTMLRRLARDWRQGLNQAFEFWKVDRFSMFKKGGPELRQPNVEDGSVLYWPEELISYPDGRSGLDTECESVKQGRVGPIADAATRPCATCTLDAYLVGHLHLPRKYLEERAMDRQNHFRRFLLCLECVSLASIDKKCCEDCVRDIP